jgi:hypothetical protein
MPISKEPRSKPHGRQVFRAGVKKVPKPGPVSVKWSASGTVFWPFSGASDKMGADPLGSMDLIARYIRVFCWGLRAK